jgi:MFS family permease
MLWFICFFNYADRQAIAAVLKVLQDQYGFDEFQLGLIGSAFMWVYAFTAPFAGQVGDRFSRKFIILAGLYVWSAITGFTALCTKAWQFIFVRAAEGLGETFYFPASMSLVSDYHSPRTRSRAMSIHQTSVYAGTIGGSYLAGWMAQRYYWQLPFILLGVLGIVLGLMLSAFIREPRRNEAQLLEQQEADGTTNRARAVHVNRERALEHTDDAPPIPMATFLAEMLRTPTALALVTAFFGANFVGMIFLMWMPKFLGDKFGLSLAMAGLGATFFIQIASMIGSVLGGVLADRWSKRLPGGRIAVQATGMILGAPFILLCGQTQEMTILVGAMTLFGLFKGMYDANIWASLYDVVPASRRGMTMSAAIASTAVVYLAVAAILLCAAFVFARRDVARALALS